MSEDEHLIKVIIHPHPLTAHLIFFCAATISYAPSTIPQCSDFLFNTLKAVCSFFFFPGRNCRQPMSAAKLKQTSLFEQKVLLLETQTHSLTPELMDCRFFSFWEIQFDNL